MESQEKIDAAPSVVRCSSCGLEVGPLNAERLTLDELLVELNKWKKIASGRTCVSFECLCFGASSLWHQTHRENFRAVDRQPEALSRWILQNEGSVAADFPKQVLEVLKRLKSRVSELESHLATTIELQSNET